MALRRGFKAEAERLANDIWSAMHLKPSDCMDAVDLARHAGCIVRSAGTLVDIARLKELKRIQGHDAGTRPDWMTTAERTELRQLRRENRQLRLEREILSKAAGLV